VRPSTQPTNRHMMRTGSVTLYFDNDQADFYARGGICWPMAWGYDHKINGHVLIAGQDIDTGEITIFREQEFVSVSNIIENGKIIFAGLESFFISGWSDFYLRDFFWHGNQITTKKWRLGTIRNNMIDPKPFFLNVDWAGDDQAALMMWHELKTENINMKPIGEKSILVRDINSIQKNDPNPPPSVHALMALIAGYNRYPWRQR
jgi:hypothetical protein